MNFVVLITITSIWLFIPLGVLKGFILRFLSPIESIYCSIVINIVLHFIGVCFFCLGGYYFSQANLINYDVSALFNIVFICFAGFILYSLDIVLTKYLIIKTSLLIKFSKPMKYFILCWWGMYSSIFLLPLLLGNSMSFSNNYKTIYKKVNIDQLSKLPVKSIFQNKEIVIHSYPYGGIVVNWDGKKKVVNYQTFFYRWLPASFYFDHNMGFVFFKVNQEVFLYDIRNEKTIKTNIN